MRTPLLGPIRLSVLVCFGLGGCGSFEHASLPGATSHQGAAGPRSAYQLKSLGGTHGIKIQPLTNAIQLTGYTDTADVKVEVLRVDHANVPLDFTKLVVIATATGAVDAAGQAGINLAGGPCFTGITPTIMPDDIVRVTLDSGSYDESKVAQVTCIRPRMEGATLAVHGNATSGFYNDRLPLDQLAVQLISTSGPFEATHLPVLTASVAGAPGVLRYDDLPVLPGDLTASFKGLSGPDLARALSANVRIVWLGQDPAAGNEATTFELLADPNAAAGVQNGCLPGIVNAITTTDHPVITAANALTDFQFGGTAGPDVSEVAISVNQGPPVKVVLPQTTRQKAWSLTVPAASIGAAPGGGGAKGRAAAAGGAGGGAAGGAGADAGAAGGAGAAGAGAGAAGGGYTAQATFTTPAGPPISLGGVAPALGFFQLVMPNVGAGATILANPGAGAYATPVNLELNLLPSGGRVFYTTDGSTPTAASTRYTGRPIQLNESASVKYMAVLPDGTSTPVQASSYAIGMPLFVEADPPQGTYFIAQYVNLSIRQPGTIHYTLDGSTPTAASFPYDGTPILIRANHTTTALKYLAVDANGKETPVVTSLYTINDVTAPSVEARPSSPLPAVTQVAPLVGPPTVRLYASEDATIYYTTDGSEPTTASTVYSTDQGVVITRAMLTMKNPAKVKAATLKWMAVDLAGNQGPTATALYRL